MVSTDEILRKYSSKIEKQMKEYDSSNNKFSKSYEDFKAAMMPEFSRYERLCKSFGNFLRVGVSKKDKERLQRNIDIAHLNITPEEAIGFSFFIFFSILFLGFFIFLLIYLFSGEFPFGFLFLVFLISIFLFYYSSKIPERLAIKWRIKASSQMVPAILYIVIYMKHTSNFEKAISFAAEHLDDPLASDFRKIFWDVEVGKFSSIKDSVDNYLNGWRDYSMEFIEAFHLIESSLYEPDESRRIEILERSLQVILDGVYDKMLKYTHDVRAPLTNIYMLGVVLPTLALAVLPIASTMLQGSIEWYHLFIIFNLFVPFLVLYMTNNVMMQRPGGHGDTSLIEKNPFYEEYIDKSHYFKAFLISFPFFLIGIIPLLFRYTPVPFWLGLKRDYTWVEIGLGFFGKTTIFGIVDPISNTLYGPSGILSVILSFFVPLSLSLFFIISFNLRTKNLIKAREEYKKLESEFTSSLFQLGNRIGDGNPVEVAFTKTIDSTKGSSTEGFFKIVSENVQKLGMGIERAIFDSRRGAIVFYPSELISISMRILIESSRKGLKVAARSLISISEYVKNMKKVSDRLNDLLAEIISDMKSNMTFLAPLLGGIVIGLSSMIMFVVGGLFSLSLSSGFEEEVVGGLGGIKGFLSALDPVNMIPTYWLQIVLSLYIIEIVFILTSTLVIIRSGRDPLEETSETAKNLKIAITMYLFISFLSTVLLSFIASVVLKNIG